MVTARKATERSQRLIEIGSLSSIEYFCRISSNMMIETVGGRGLNVENESDVAQTSVQCEIYPERRHWKFRPCKGQISTKCARGRVYSVPECTTDTVRPSVSASHVTT